MQIGQNTSTRVRCRRSVMERTLRVHVDRTAETLSSVLDEGRGIPVARPVPKNLKSAFRLNDAVLELIIA